MFATNVKCSEIPVQDCMIVYKVYKTELKLNNKEKTYFRACAGTARYTYNWGLARKIAVYQETGKSISAAALHKELNQLKKGELAWMYDYSKCIPQQALRDLDQAYANFFRRVAAGEEKAGFPKFKSKHTARKSFYLEGSITVAAKEIRLPRIGWARLKERGYLPCSDVRNLSCRITERAGRWFVSLFVEEEIADMTPRGEIVGIDLGINRLSINLLGRVLKSEWRVAGIHRPSSVIDASARKRIWLFPNGFTDVNIAI